MEFDVISATTGQGYAVLAACPEWASVSTESKREELDQRSWILKEPSSFDILLF